MTDNEIIKALEICTNGECSKGCPYAKVEGCMEQNGADAIALINRQKAEIERLQGVVCTTDKLVEKTAHLAKSEAVKGFEKMLIDKSQNGVIAICDLPDYVLEFLYAEEMVGEDK